MRRRSFGQQHAALAQRLPPHRRAEPAALGGAGQGRQALRRRGLEARARSSTIIKQSYLLTARWLQSHGAARSRARRQDRAQGRFLYAPVRRRAWRRRISSLTNPEVLRATIESGGENLVNGLRAPARRSRARQGPADDQDDRHRRLQGRREHRRHARQGRLPERPDAAHPIRADDREGAAPAAADHAALDQQILHPRSAAARIRSSNGRSSRAIRCS